jgi:hypothetical protein
VERPSTISFLGLVVMAEVSKLFSVVAVGEVSFRLLTALPFRFHSPRQMPEKSPMPVQADRHQIGAAKGTDAIMDAEVAAGTWQIVALRTDR